RILPAPPGARLLRLPPSLLLIASGLHEQKPLGIRHGELPQVKRLQSDLVHRLFVIIIPIIAADTIRPALYTLQRWVQVLISRGPLAALKTRIAQIPQGQPGGNARPQV